MNKLVHKIINLKKRCVFLLFILTFSLNIYSQGTWVQKSNVFPTTRAGVVAFSIDGKGYFGNGWQFASQVFYNDFWEWDEASNIWTQKASFPGDPRGDAVGYSIGNKGYILTGKTQGGWAGPEYYEWDQASNAWSQKANFPGANRGFGAAFSIGLKGYVGCGYDPNGGAFSDFWQWDQPTDTWMQLADIPIERYCCVAFSIETKGYVGTGEDASDNYLDDFWEYDPASNTWTQKANFPGGVRSFASGFSIGNRGYLGTGYDDANISYDDFWQYNPANDTWSAMANYPHLVTDIDHASFSIACKGYFGCGATDPTTGIPYFNDFWEYQPDTCNLTGIAAFSDNSPSLYIYMDPFSEQLYVSLNSNASLEIIIYDMDAKKVIQKNFKKSVSINTSRFANGIYFYEVKNKNTVIKTGKISKQ